MKKIQILGAVGLLGLMLASTAYAAEFVAPEKGSNGNLTFSSTEKHKNLYTAGANVTIDSNVTGDLFVAGGIVTVNGNVEKDLFVAGGNISLNGQVGNNLRVAGGNITINSPINGDLLVGGGNVNITEKSSVAGDLIIGGGNVIIDSPVFSNVKIAGGSVTINSRVSGSVEVMANKDLTFGSSSVVMGSITYKGPSEPKIQDGAKVGTIDYTMVASRNPARKIVELLTIAAIIKLLGLFVAAWAVNRLFPGKFQSLANEAFAKPWHNLGIGVLFLIATPIVAVILMITVLGIYLGLALMAIYLLVLLIAGFLSPYYLGAMLIAWYKKSSTLKLSWYGLIYGLLVMTIVALIPFIGWLAVAVLYAICVGSVVIHTLKSETSVNI